MFETIIIYIEQLLFPMLVAATTPTPFFIFLSQLVILIIIVATSRTITSCGNKYRTFSTSDILKVADNLIADTLIPCISFTSDNLKYASFTLTFYLRRK